MKKILLVSVLALVTSGAAFASGVLGTDTPQSGTTIVPAGPTLITNTFNPSFSVAPVVLVAASTTNAFPFTNTSITISNFVVAVGATNSAFNWQAYVAPIVMQSGTNLTPGDVLVTNTFTINYARIPAIAVIDSALGTNSAVVTGYIQTNSPAASISGFIMTVGTPTNRTFRWHAIGETYSPGARIVTTP